MKIEDKHIGATVPFSSVNVGEVFQWSGGVYFKLRSGYAVVFEPSANGELNHVMTSFSANTPVTKRDAVLILN